MTEIYLGPVEQWKPDNHKQLQIAEMLSSDNELTRALGEAYSKRCYVKEFSTGSDDSQDGMTAVGDFDEITELEFRCNTTADTKTFTLEDCISLGTFPGEGVTRVARVLDGIRQVERARGRTLGPERLELFSSFTEGDCYVEAFMPTSSSQELQWTVRFYDAKSMTLLKEDTISMTHDAIFGVDGKDKATLENYVNLTLQELINS